MVDANEPSHPWLDGDAPPRLGLWIAGLILLSILCYTRSLDGELFFDNEPMIELDTRIRSLDGLGEILSTHYWSGIAQSTLFRPLTTSTYYLNYSLLGNETEPLGYHVVNVLLHALTAVSLLFLLRRLRLPPLVQVGATFLFAAHPVAVESVANIVGRADILSALFVVLALQFHISVRHLQNPGLRRVLPALMFALAMGSKESGIVFIGLALAFDLGPGCSLPSFRDRKRFLRDYAGLLIALVVMQGWRLWVVRDIPPREFDVGDNALVLGTFLEREATVLKILAMYFGRLLWPMHLSADHSYPQITVVENFLDFGFLIGLAVLVLWLVAMIVSYRRAPMVGFFLAFVPIALAPVSNAIILIGTIMAERLLYLPMMGFWVLIAWGLVAFSTKLSKPKAMTIAMALLGTATVAFGARTFERNRIWTNELVFWKSTHESSPQSLRAINGYARASFLENPEDPKTALEIQRRCLDVGVQRARSLARLGEYLSRTASLELGEGQPPSLVAERLIEAKAHLERAEQLDREARIAWADRNHWYEGHPHAAPMNEIAVYESWALWFDAKAQILTDSARDAWADSYQRMLRRWIFSRPGTPEPALRWLKAAVDREQFAEAIQAAPYAVALNRGNAEIISLLTQAYEGAGLSPDQWLRGPGGQFGMRYPGGERGTDASKLRAWLAKGWNLYAKLYAAQGYRDVAKQVISFGKRSGVPPTAFDDALKVQDPEDESFWK